MYINLLNTMVSKILKFGKQKGSSLSLPAHGRAGARATSSLAAHFAKRNTKFGGGGKARAGKNSFPPTPFLFARPSLKVFQNSAFGFSLKKVRISFSVRSTKKISVPTGLIFFSCSGGGIRTHGQCVNSALLYH